MTTATATIQQQQQFVVDVVVNRYNTSTKGTTDPEGTHFLAVLYAYAKLVCTAMDSAG